MELEVVEAENAVSSRADRERVGHHVRPEKGEVVAEKAVETAAETAVGTASDLIVAPVADSLGVEVEGEEDRLNALPKRL